MISKYIEWIKFHKLTTLLLLIVILFVGNSFWKTSVSPLNTRLVSPMMDARSTSTTGMATDSYGIVGKSEIAPQFEYAPTAGIANRMVVQNSYLSLLVSDVVDIKKKILNYSNEIGGYMVSAETTNPQDAPTATITVRIPSEKLSDTLEKFRGLGIKVVSESLVGNDVTDQYVDIEARIETLEKTKVAMEAILAKAQLVSDLSNITQQIIGIQSQIDSLKGSQKSLAENAKLSKITIYLSTDEIALPYAPNDTFRPSVIFKLAVRALISNLRSIASFLIWIAVYAVIWVPLVVVIYFVTRYFGKRK